METHVHLNAYKCFLKMHKCVHTPKQTNTSISRYKQSPGKTRHFIAAHGLKTNNCYVLFVSLHLRLNL